MADFCETFHRILQNSWQQLKKLKLKIFFLLSVYNIRNNESRKNESLIAVVYCVLRR